jgi:exonuclease SbcC
MRPVSLELEGFAAFRERTVVDFRGAELFAIVGATGHGKSTLIDAVCFALYGSVPRHGERDIAPVMTLGCNETKVSFAFELAGTTYVATRVLRRKPSGDGATTRALRLETVHEDGTSEVLAGAKGEFQAQVQRLIGLDFDQFTKCVVLPQGEFAAFLHARAGERVAILSALLDLGRYDRMATAARERAKQAAARREALGAERARLGDVSDEALREACARRDALDVLRADAEAALPHDAALARDAAQARAGEGAARSALAALGAVTVPAEVQALARQIDDARRRADAAEAAAEQAEARAAAAERARDALPPLDVLGATVDAHADRAQLAERIAKGEEVLAERAATAERAKDALVAERAAVDAAQAALDDAQHRHAHAELRASLRKGEPCPVCEQPVTTLPPKLRATELQQARKALGAQRKALARAETDAQQVLAAHEQAKARLASLRDQLAEVEARVAAFPDADEAGQALAAARAAHALAASARTEATRARAAAQQAAQALAGYGDALARAHARMLAQRDALVAAGLAPPPAGDDPHAIAVQWQALATWAAETRPEHEKRAAEMADLAAAKTAERDALVDDLFGRAQILGIAPPGEETVDALALAVVGATHDAVATCTRLAEHLARAAELDAEIAAAREGEVVTAALGRLLDKAHFGQWLVEEALGNLVTGASELLERCSGGQYALTTGDDGELLVVDHVNADETRSVRSLSGGETFQASLALALALANRISELSVGGAAALESMFLDEGFGTLDPETLDVVAGTIESLGVGERVVGVVTHVAELAERMPVRFRVRKEGRTAVVTREEA